MIRSILCDGQEAALPPALMDLLRVAQVEMKCSEGDAVSITAVEEPTVCSYLMSISCPLACGGAWRAIPATSEAPPATLTATATPAPESPASVPVEVLPTAVVGVQ